MSDNELRKEIEDWWATSIIRMEPNVIEIRGKPIEELIGNVTFPQMIWLCLRGTLPSEAEAKLLEAALVASVDHGPQAPSIAIARMAITCGIGINNAMASAINVLGDNHGGAGEQAVELYTDIDKRWNDSTELQEAVAQGLASWRDARGKYIPGFGHRFHQRDPRSPRLMELVAEAKRGEVVSGRFAEIAQCIEATLTSEMGKPVPMNIDGATAVIYAELGFPAPLARGLFCLSRSVGILAHAWEQSRLDTRNMGPYPLRKAPLSG